MSEAEKLMADVPADDPHFLLEVTARIERRHFRRELMRTGLLTVAATILLALVVPQLGVSALAAMPQDYDIALAAVLMAVTMLLPRLSQNL
jgi:hypothetical protein